jgi:hypothetical protein
MKVKKFNDKKKEEGKDILFSAKSLEKDKEEKPSFKTSVDDQEKVEKEFKKELDKIEKFESFITISITNDDDDLGISDDFVRPTDEYEVDKQSSIELRGADFLEDEIDSDYQESEMSGCGCCNSCSGEQDCECGCENCKCSPDENIQRASDFINSLFSENLKYHLDNNKPITENIFRPGSESFYDVIKEARKLFDLGRVKLCDIDKEIYESTEIGKFGYFNGELVPLDLPMENIESIQEAELFSRNPNGTYSAQTGNDDIMMTIINSSSFFDTLDFSEIVEEYYDFIDPLRQKAIDDVLEKTDPGEEIYDYF